MDELSGTSSKSWDTNPRYSEPNFGLPSKLLIHPAWSKFNFGPPSNLRVESKAGSGEILAIEYKDERERNAPQNPDVFIHDDWVTGAICCDKCGDAINGNFNHCTICNDGYFDLCLRCVDSGYHCHTPEHWMVALRFKNGTLSGRETEIVKTLWTLCEINGEPESEEPLPITRTPYPLFRFNREPESEERPRGASYKPRPQVTLVYDYCFQCGIRFPIDEPPRRHVWELHGTEDLPAHEADDSTEKRLPELPTKIWMKQPTVEEQELHELKLEKMQSEMKMIFRQQVLKKEQNLKRSEEELYARYTEMKAQLGKMRSDVEEKQQLQREAPEKKTRERRAFKLR
ncbi:hypothetical protein EG329_011046 [Mollisiaceae sp. DMI_Dod_QoI]|nr:hypothetical protein EG329_011046 [Helotiales sp. DMI_Dod_QoI]